jgi:hypothetical protein
MPEPASFPEHLQAEKKKVILELLTSSNITQVGYRTGISRATIHHWLDDKEFIAAYHNAAEEVWKDALFAIKVATTKAVAKLVSLLDSRDDEIALKAAQQILDGGYDADIALAKIKSEEGNATSGAKILPINDRQSVSVG